MELKSVLFFSLPKINVKLGYSSIVLDQVFRNLLLRPIYHGGLAQISWKTGNYFFGILSCLDVVLTSVLVAAKLT
jgi:hypothetical protein